MSTLTVTHTRTHLVITPANPFLACCRELAPGEPMPQPVCGDRTFEGGTWHWPERA